jgi:antitoxin MazE
MRGLTAAPGPRLLRGVVVKNKFLKWGDSLALRIPAVFAKEIGASVNKVADMTVRNGTLVVRVQKEKRRRHSLERLLEGITRENYHREIDWGLRVGNEYW